MKKYIITAGVLVLTIGIWWYTASAAIVVVDSYSESNQNTSCAVYSPTLKGCGQTFTATGTTLDSAVFYVSKFGAPTGSVYAVLYAISGTSGVNGTPTGSALATSDAFDISTLTTSHALKTFTFSGADRYSMVNGTNYAIVLEYTNGDGSNALFVGSDNTTPTDDGNQVQYIASWTAPSNSDVVFYVYGDDSGGSPVSLSTVSDIVLFE